MIITALQHVSTHAGKPIPRNADFFADPPLEIGPILSADTTLRIGKKPLKSWRYWLRVLWICTAIVTVLVLINGTGRGRDPVGFSVIIAMIAFPIVSILTGVYSQFIHVCSYVGERGIARFTLEDSRKQSSRSYVVLFDQIDCVFVCYLQVISKFGSNMSHYIRWQSNADVSFPLLTIDHAGVDWSRRTRQAVAFLRASESAWTKHAWGQLQNDIQDNSEHEFAIIDNHASRVGKVTLAPDRLAIDRLDSSICILLNEISSFQIIDGICTLKTSGKNVPARITLPYHELGNAALFSSLMNSVLATAEIPASNQI